MTPRERTAPYPDNPRSEWAIRWLANPTRQSDGLYHFAYEVYPTAQSRARGDLPFLLNSHKAMMRETHQRIQLDANGFLMHQSGIAVPPEDLEDFLKNDPRAYRWVQAGHNELVEWEDDRRRRLSPFIFNTYWGKPEALDPQWKRELYTLPFQQQLIETYQRYFMGVEARRLSGDHRGTTLDLQVAASADDAHETDASTDFTSISTAIKMNSNVDAASRYNGGTRFTGATIQGTTIDVMYSSHVAFSAGTNEVNVDIFGEDVDDADDFATDADVTGRLARNTAASVVWSEGGLSDVAYNNSPSLVSVGQELADRPTFADNALVLLFEGRSVDPQDSQWGQSYDNASGDSYRLHIEFTTPSGDVPSAAMGSKMVGADLI